MPKLTLNPFKWFRRAGRARRIAPALSSRAGGQARADAKQREKVLVYLVTLQKSLSSLQLALEQDIDIVWLVQKVTGDISLIKLEASKTNEEKLTEVAGKVRAYFETIAEGRLELDAEGIEMISEFVRIFGDILGGRTSQADLSHINSLNSWDTQYQALMAKMKPIVGTDEPADRDTDAGVDERIDEAEPCDADATDEDPGAGPETEERDAGSLGRIAATIRNPVLDDLIKESAYFDAQTHQDSVVSRDDAGTDSAKEEAPDAERVSYDLPPRDRVKDMQVHDVAVHGEAEKTDDRGILEAEEQERRHSPEIAERSAAVPQAGDGPGANVPAAGQASWSPVELQEVERLKKKLFMLHEKQEMLSSKMSGILGDFEKAVKKKRPRKEPVPVDQLDVGELEDLIFIGRKKG